MSKSGWVIFVIPLAVWGLYSCWYYGYQSGYAEGHETALKHQHPLAPFRVVASFEPAKEVDDFSEMDGR